MLIEFGKGRLGPAAWIELDEVLGIAHVEIRAEEDEEGNPESWEDLGQRAAKVAAYLAMWGPVKFGISPWSGLGKEDEDEAAAAAGKLEAAIPEITPSDTTRAREEVAEANRRAAQRLDERIAFMEAQKTSEEEDSLTFGEAIERHVHGTERTCRIVEGGEDPEDQEPGDGEHGQGPSG